MASRTIPPALPSKPGTNGAVQGMGVPNQSLYIKNLNDKINKDDLRRALYMLFSTYGPILDITTQRIGSKGQKMRGQAHICFRDIQTSTQAMRALQGFEIFGKEMNIAYAKGTSSIIPKLRGTFEPPVAPAPATEANETQKSIFAAPPSGIPPKPVQNGVPALKEAPHGTKRSRDDTEEEEEEEEDVPMEEEDDASMEEDDDDD